MVIKESHSTREDGVKLVRTLDAVVDENGKPVLDEEGKLIPTGFLIRKLGTQQTYAEAIDVEYARYRYVETQTPIEVTEAE